jgi:hypothetical protein
MSWAESHFALPKKFFQRYLDYSHLVSVYVISGCFGVAYCVLYSFPPVPEGCFAKGAGFTERY